MTLADHDKRCNELFRKLDALKAIGQGGKIASPEYLSVLAELHKATKERLTMAGVIVPSIGG